jgi:uncharacterized protein (TIRG00374 family)
METMVSRPDEAVLGRGPDDVIALPIPQHRCSRWWWHAPRSRCVGLRARTFHHAGVRMAIGVGLAVLLLLVGLLHRSGTGRLVMESIRSARMSWLLVAVVLQAGSMGTFAHLQQRVLAGAGLRLPMSSSLAIAYAGNAVAVTIPFAGTTASAAFTYRQYVQRGAPGTMAGWAMAVAGLFSTTTFAVLVGVAAIANGNPLAAAAGITGIAAFVIPAVLVTIAVRHPSAHRNLERAAARVLSISKRLVGRPRNDPAQAVADAMTQLSAYRLRTRYALAATWLASLNWALDALCLWAVLQAFDVSLPLRNLPFVYVATVAAASLGLTPAGIGTVEAALAVALTNFGTDGAHAVPAALVYRAISTWLVLLIGWVVLAALRRRGRNSSDLVSTATPLAPL